MNLMERYRDDLTLLGMNVIHFIKQGSVSDLGSVYEVTVCVKKSDCVKAFEDYITFSHLFKLQKLHEAQGG